MAAIVTDQFRILNASNFVDNVTDSNNSYYVFVGLSNPSTSGFGRQTDFDTNTTSHHHFFCKNSSTLIDIESKNIKISKLPKIPNGKKLDSIEIVVNLTE